jgi:hypothetical protein
MNSYELLHVSISVFKSNSSPRAFPIVLAPNQPLMNRMLLNSFEHYRIEYTGTSYILHTSQRIVLASLQLMAYDALEPFPTGVEVMPYYESANPKIQNNDNWKLPFAISGTTTSKT